MDTNKHGLEVPSERKRIAQGKRSATLGYSLSGLQPCESVSIGVYPPSHGAMEDRSVVKTLCAFCGMKVLLVILPRGGSGNRGWPVRWRVETDADA
jgi:hypothetical protein